MQPQLPHEAPPIANDNDQRLPAPPAVRARVAVILAAGNGSRLGGGPKPLYRLLGLRLIERTVLGLAGAGVERFRVVVGAYAAELRAGLARARRLRHLPIEIVDCPDWELGNGHSLAAGAAGLDEPFILTMADHVFDPAIPERLAAAGAAAPDQVHLATDSRVAETFDLDDATKVQTAQGGRIVALGKELAAYDRVDVGLFWCPAWLAAAAQRQVARGAHGVSAVMAAALGEGRLRSCPIEPLVWQDVDTPAMAREARRRLLASTRKATDGPVSRLFNRPLSIFVTGLLAPLGVTPNMMTTFVFAMGLVSAALAASLDYSNLVWAALLFHLSSVLDGSDGELARVTLRRSAFGAWYDTITDNLRYGAMVLGAAVGLWRRDGHAVYLALAVGFVWGAVHLVRTMNAYVQSVQGPGTHLVVLAEVERQRGDLGRSLWFRFLLSIRKLMKNDVMAVLAAAALLLDLRGLVLGGGLFAVFAAQGVVERAVGARPGGQRWWQRATVVAGSVGLVALLDALPTAELPALLGRLGPVLPVLVVVAVAWMAAYALAMREILERAVGFTRLLYNRIVGEAYNVLTPLAGLGGDPLRVLDLAPQVGTARAIRAVVLDRFAYAAGGLIFSALGVLAAVRAYAWEAAAERALLGYAAAALLASAILFLVATRPASAHWTGRLLRLARVRAPVLPRAMPAATFARVLGANLVGRLLGLVEIAVLLAALGQPVTVDAVIAISALLAISGIVFFFVPSGIGVSEGAAVLALTWTGHGEAVGLAVGLARRLRLLLTAGLGVALSAAKRPAAPPAAAADPQTPLRDRRVSV